MKSSKKEIIELQNRVLIGIGRNVLNLGKMEGMLKALVLNLGAVAPLGGTETALRKRKKAISKRPMGRLVNDFVRSLHSHSADDGKEEKRSNSITIETSLKFKESEFVRELKSSLRKVVKERNNLIHKQLVGFDPKSAKSCRSFMKELEDQRQRIKPQFEALASIWLALRKNQKEFLEYVNSSQFETELKAAHEKPPEIKH